MSEENPFMLVDSEFLEKHLNEMIHAYICIDAHPPAIVCSVGVRRMMKNSAHMQPAFAGDSRLRPTLFSEEYQGIPIVVLADAVDDTMFVTSLKQAKELISIYTLRRKFHVMAQELGI